MTDHLTNAPDLCHPRPRVSGLSVLVGVCLLVALLSRGSYALRPWDPDGAMFVYMGKLVADGGRYWVDLVDNKLPTVGLLTSPAWRAFGDHWLAYVALQTAMAGLASLALGRVVARAVGDHARWPTTLFALVYLNLNTAVFGGFQLETIHAFFASLAALAAVNVLTPTSRWRHSATPSGTTAHALADAATVGLCAGVAALAKPTGLAVLGALAVVLVLRPIALRHTLASVAGLTLGLALVAATALAYFLATDTLRHWPANLAQVREYAAHAATDLRDVNKLVWAAVVVGLPIIARAWVFRRDRLDPTGVPAAPTRDSRVLAFACCWLALEALGVVLQKRMYGYHFLVLAPPAALVFGLLPRRAATKQLALCLAPALVLSFVGAVQVIAFSWRLSPRLESSDWLASHAAPTDAVWRDMTARLLIETDLRPGSRYPLTFLFTNSDTAPQAYWQEMRRDFEARRPRWVVLPRDLPAYLRDTATMIAELERLDARRANYLSAWAELESYVQTHYAPVATLGRETVYERRFTQTASVE